MCLREVEEVVKPIQIILFRQCYTRLKENVRLLIFFSFESKLK